MVPGGCENGSRSIWDFRSSHGRLSEIRTLGRCQLSVPRTGEMPRHKKLSLWEKIEVEERTEAKREIIVVWLLGRNSVSIHWKTEVQMPDLGDKHRRNPLNS